MPFEKTDRSKEILAQLETAWESHAAGSPDQAQWLHDFKTYFEHNKSLINDFMLMAGIKLFESVNSISEILTSFRRHHVIKPTSAAPRDKLDIVTMEMADKGYNPAESILIPF